MNEALKINGFGVLQRMMMLCGKMQSRQNMGSMMTWVGELTGVLILTELACWKSILASLERFKSLVHFEVKDGSRFLFWYDVYCGDQPL